MWAEQSNKWKNCKDVILEVSFVGSPACVEGRIPLLCMRLSGILFQLVQFFRN